MTKESLIENLIARELVISVAGKYYFTDNVNKVFNMTTAFDSKSSDKKQDKVLSFTAEMLLASDNGYPLLFDRLQSVKLLDALYTHLSIKNYQPGLSGGRYLLQTRDKETADGFTQVVRDAEFDGKVVMKTIAKYYKSVSFPKGFGRFLREDFESLYVQMAEGKDPFSDNKPTNETVG